MSDPITDPKVFEKLQAGFCPDCGHRGFLLGPRGGVSINVECANELCASRFNVAPFGWNTLLHAERLPPGQSQ